MLDEWLVVNEGLEQSLRLVNLIHYQGRKA